jgi:hypothetical protein
LQEMWTPLSLAASCDSLCSYLKSLAAEPYNSWRELGTFIGLKNNTKKAHRSTETNV